MNWMVIISIIVALLIIREFLAILLGWGRGEGERSFSEFMEDRRDNAAIERQWEKNGRPVVSTTMGWRPDPHNKQDGYRDNGNDTYDKLLRGGTKEYREKFNEKRR